MHELSLCRQLLLTLPQYLDAKQSVKITKIWLEVGALAAVDEQAMLFCFSVAAKGSVAEGAELIVDTVSAQASCLDCQRAVSLNQWPARCSFCKSFTLELISGEQLIIKKMETRVCVESVDVE